MTFLPIVQRELRVGARRKSTYRIRFWTAILAIILGFVSLMFLLMTRGRSGVGNSLFGNLTGYAFGLCLLAGVFLTADCLSEEKREGTLGLLFLTDLHGYDVVLGKFVAMGITALYGLLALLPITAISLVLGGVTGGEFWRTAVALMNALFVSLAGGIWVSARAREAQRAMGRVLALLLLLVVALPALASIGGLAHWPSALLIPCWASPFYPFSYASATLYFGHSARFWASLTISHALGWVFLALASGTLPRSWQQGTIQIRPARIVHRWLRRRQANPIKRAEIRRELLPVNPILWLVTTESGFGRLAWAIVVVWAAVVVLVTIASPREVGTFLLNGYGARPFGFLLKLLFTIQVCRFFADARRNGALEMLLCTPLTNKEIIRGQGMALRRMFLWPGVVFVVLMFLPVVAHVISALASFDFQRLMTGGFGLFVSLVTAARTVADFFALYWLGLWLALTMKKPSLASAMTILAVLILPSVLCWLDLLADLFFILWGATKMQQDLRWVLARQSEMEATRLQARVVPPPSGVPPVIAQ
jgi:ABC-type transport system involved in multi-copper enzyme maturation permease subunit